MSIGFWQVILILVVVLILFGAGKLPRVMGDLAKGVKSFRAGLKEDEVEGRSTGEADHGSSRPPGISSSGEATATHPEMKKDGTTQG